MILKSNLMCTQCGNVFPVQAKKVETNTKGHTKKLWCISCKKATGHIEIGEISIRFIMYKINQGIDLNRVERIFMDVMSNLGEDKNSILIKLLEFENNNVSDNTVDLYKGLSYTLK